MHKIITPKPTVRNWVAKHNRNRAVRQRVRTHYQRHAKHRQANHGQD